MGRDRVQSLVHVGPESCGRVGVEFSWYKILTETSSQEDGLESCMRVVGRGKEGRGGSRDSYIGAFELCCWRGLLRVPWTSRRSNQSILKEISPEYSLEGQILKFQYFGHLMQRADSLEETLMLGKMEGRRRGRQESLVCCSPWGRKESDTTERLKWTELRRTCGLLKTWTTALQICLLPLGGVPGQRGSKERYYVEPSDLSWIFSGALRGLWFHPALECDGEDATVSRILAGLWTPQKSYQVWTLMEW